MARTEARIRTSIWDDADYLALSVDAQWLYQAIVEQKDLSACGVLTWSAGRFARLSRGQTKKRVDVARRELERARFLVVDDDTDELWVRTFFKHDGVLSVPNMVVSMSHGFVAVHSDRLRDLIAGQLRAQFGEDIYVGIAAAFPSWRGLVQRLAEGFRQHFPVTLPSNPNDQPLPLPLTPDPSPYPTPHVPNPNPPPPSPSPPDGGTAGADPPAVSGPALLAEALSRIGRPPGDGPVTGGVGYANGVKPTTLAERLAGACTGENRRLVESEARAVVEHLTAHVDPKVVDEAIGAYLAGDKRPALPRALVPAVQRRVPFEVPVFRPAKARAR